jgi:hypothetical protein
MGKQFRLTIADPCHENWDQMTPAEKGRFCGSCQKQVVDFTGMTDGQIATFFKKTTGSVCGRFMDDQLDRNIAIPKKRIPWVKYFFQFSLPLFLASLKSGAQKSNSRDNLTGNRIEVQTTVGVVLPGPEIEITHFSREIMGVVVDEDGNPVPYASIMIKGTSLGVQADRDGGFIIEIPAKKNVEMQISSVGFEAKQFNVFIPNMQKFFQLSKLTLTEVVVVGYPFIRCKSITGAVSYVSEQVDSVAEKTENKTIPEPLTDRKSSSAAIVYPNPLVRGGTITIELRNNLLPVARVRIISLDGKLVLTQDQRAKDQKRFTVQADPRWAAGIYFVQLIDEKRKLIQTEKLVVQ